MPRNTTHRAMEDKLEEYKKLKEQLKQELQKKRVLEDEFDKIQQEIYDKETEYFTSSTYMTSSTTTTASGAVSTKPLQIPGNIIKGFDGFTKPLHHAHHDYSQVMDNQDRIFSLSSASYIKQTSSLDKYLQDLHQANGEDTTA